MSPETKSKTVKKVNKKQTAKKEVDGKTRQQERQLRRKLDKLTDRLTKDQEAAAALMFLASKGYSATDCHLGVQIINKLMEE